MAEKALDIVMRGVGVEQTASGMDRVKRGLEHIGHEAKEMGKEAKAGSEEAERGFKGLIHRMKEAIKTSLNLTEAMEFGGIAGGLFFLFDQLRDISKEALEDSVAVQRLQSSLKLAGDQSAESAEDMVKFADAIVKSTTVSKGEALEGMAQLASEGRLTGESLKSATTAAIGLSERLHIQLPTAFNIVSRAVLGHMDILSRYGVEVDKTKTPLENIQHIIDEGNVSFGLAKDRVNTFTGAWTRLKNELSMVKSDLGEDMNVFAKVINVFSEAIPKVEEWAEELRAQLRPAFHEIAVVAVDSFNRIKEVVEPVMAWLVRFVTDTVAQTVKFVATALMFIHDHIGAVKGALIGMGAALTALKLYEHFNRLAKSVKAVTMSAKAMVGVLTSGPIGILLAIGAAVGFVVTKLGLWTPILHAASKAWDFLKKAAKPALEAIEEAAKAVGDVVRNGVAIAFNFLAGVVKTAIREVLALDAALLEWATGTTSVKDAIGVLAQYLKAAVVGMVVWIAKLEFGFKHWREVAGFTVAEVVHAVYKFANELQHVFTVVIPTYLDFFLRNWKNIFNDEIHFTEAVFKNLGKNFANFAVAVKNFLKGGGWHFDWTPLTEGFKSTTEKLPEIMKRQEGPLEKQARVAMETLGAELKKGADENVKKRLKQLFHIDPDEAEKDGKDAAEKFKKGAKDELGKPNPQFDPGHDLPGKDNAKEDKAVADLRGTLSQAHSLFFGAGRDAAAAAKGQREVQIDLQRHANVALDDIKKGVQSRPVEAVNQSSAGGIEAQLVAALQTLAAKTEAIVNELQDFKKDRANLNRYAESIAENTSPDAGTNASALLG